MDKKILEAKCQAFLDSLEDIPGGQGAPGVYIEIYTQEEQGKLDRYVLSNIHQDTLETLRQISDKLLSTLDNETIM